MKTTSRQANMQSKPRPRAQTQNGRMRSPLARRKFGAHGSGRPTMSALAKVRVSVGRAVLCAPPQRKLQINDETLLRATCSFEHMGFLRHCSRKCWSLFRHDYERGSNGDQEQ